MNAARGTIRLALGALLAAAPAAAVTAQEAIRFASGDGYELAARYYPADSPGPGVLLLHQCDRRDLATGYEALARELAARGHHVLVPDYRTYGASVGPDYPAGDWRRAGPHMAGDTQAAYAYLVSRPEVRAGSVGVVGASCGGRQAIALAARESGVRAVVLLSSQLGPQVRPDLERLEDLPLLCVVAEHDPFGATTTSMRQACDSSGSETRRLIELPGDAHGTPLLAQERALTGEVAEWLNVHLRAAAEDPPTLPGHEAVDVSEVAPSDGHQRSSNAAIPRL